MPKFSPEMWHNLSFEHKFPLDLEQRSDMWLLPHLHLIVRSKLLFVYINSYQSRGQFADTVWHDDECQSMKCVVKLLSMEFVIHSELKGTDCLITFIDLCWGTAHSGYSFWCYTKQVLRCQWKHRWILCAEAKKSSPATQRTRYCLGFIFDNRK